MDNLIIWINTNPAYAIIIAGAVAVIILFVLLVIFLKKRAKRKSGYRDADQMDGRDFEIWCADLLSDNGFGSIRLTKGSGDQGVDILATKDDVRFAIQCKFYSSPLGNRPVQEVFTGKTIYNCHVGVVMTNSTFTSGAKEAAEKTGVILWDADKLRELAGRR